MPRKRSWTDEQLKKAVEGNQSVYGVLTQIGLSHGGGSHAVIKLRIKQLNLDTSHFTGSGWCFGDKHKEFIKKVSRDFDQILVKESTYQNTYSLKKRLLQEKILENKCSECGLEAYWNRKPIALQLDHIDGDRCNNLIENLRILCPNCHSQTDTFTGRNKKKKRQTSF